MASRGRGRRRCPAGASVGRGRGRESVEQTFRVVGAGVFDFRGQHSLPVEDHLDLKLAVTVLEALLVVADYGPRTFVRHRHVAGHPVDELSVDVVPVQRPGSVSLDREVRAVGLVDVVVDPPGLPIIVVDGQLAGLCHKPVWQVEVDQPVLDRQVRPGFCGVRRVPAHLHTMLALRLGDHGGRGVGDVEHEDDAAILGRLDRERCKVVHTLVVELQVALVNHDPGAAYTEDQGGDERGNDCSQVGHDNPFAIGSSALSIKYI